MTRMAGEQLGRKKSWNEGIRNDRNDRKAETTGMTGNPKRQEWPESRNDRNDQKAETTGITGNPKRQEWPESRNDMRIRNNRNYPC